MMSVSMCASSPFDPHADGLQLEDEILVGDPHHLREVLDSNLSHIVIRTPVVSSDRSVTARTPARRAGHSSAAASASASARLLADSSMAVASRAAARSRRTPGSSAAMKSSSPMPPPSAAAAPAPEGTDVAAPPGASRPAPWPRPPALLGLSSSTPSRPRASSDSASSSASSTIAEAGLLRARSRHRPGIRRRVRRTSAGRAGLGHGRLEHAGKGVGHLVLDVALRS